MERKQAAVRNALDILKDLEKSLETRPRINEGDVARNLEAYTNALAILDEAGRSMDESTSQVVPKKLFQLLDEIAPNNSNPEQYEMKLLQDANKKANNLRTRVNYLQEVQIQLEEALMKRRL